jgi:hypothetical protein
MTSQNLGDLERNKFWLTGGVTDSNCRQQFSIQCSSNHLFPLSDGSCNGFTYVNKFGRVLNYGTSIVDANDLGTPAVYSWPTSAVQIEAISSSADDVATTGTGARTIVVEGLGESWEEVSETINMAGLSASTATTQKFIRIHRAYVATCGTYGSTTAGPHIGNITIRTASAGATHIYLNAATAPVGQSLVARYTIPAGKTGYLIHANFTAAGNKQSDFYLWRRFNADTTAAPYGIKRIIETFNGITSYLDRDWHIPIRLPEKTDVWGSVIGAGTLSNASVSFDILMCDNV